MPVSPGVFIAKADLLLLSRKLKMQNTENIRIRAEHKKFIVQRLLDSTLAFSHYRHCRLSDLTTRTKLKTNSTISDDCSRLCRLMLRSIIKSNTVCVSLIHECENTCRLFQACISEQGLPIAIKMTGCLHRVRKVCRFLIRHHRLRVGTSGSKFLNRS
jgi:hypothetical protein